MNNLKVLLSLISLVFLVGCASTYRQAGVEQLNPSSMAVIEAEPCEKLKCLMLQEIDGKWRGVGWFKRYELNPGLRTIKFVYHAPYIRGKTGIVVEFLAEAGHTYGVRANADHNNMTWRPEVFDKATQEVVSRKVGTEFAY